MSYQRGRMDVSPWTIIVLSSICISVVDGSFVIINHSGRDLEADCGAVSGIIPAGERAVAVDHRSLEEKLDPLAVIRPHGHQTCRIEAGNCFVSWYPLDQGSTVESSRGNDYVEWEVDETGLVLQSSTTTPGREYKMLWQASSELLSAGAHGSMTLCSASTSSPLAQAFYSVALYFRE